MPRFGATPEEWEHFDVTLGLTSDLLPVVSDPSFKISPNSTLKTLGKVPSMLNSSDEITGFNSWTKFTASGEHIEKWQAVEAYGICIQTRYARAIDVDTEDPELSRKIYEYLESWGLPCRARENSPKFLLAFTLPGQHQKRTIKLGTAGIIEFLANGQQFIAAGTHPSGVRYQWAGGLPEEIPPVSAVEFELIWKGLSDVFGIGEATGATRTSEPRRDAAQTPDTVDPVLTHLEQAGQVLSIGKEGEAFITCPFNAEHTTEDGGTGTVYYPAGSRGYEQGHFKCLHAHCEGRSDAAFLEGVKYGGVWFEALPIEPMSATSESATPTRFPFINALDYSLRPPPVWIIKHVLPRAELAVLFGASGAAKTFIAIDMAMSIARGIAWNRKKTVKGRCAYVCAEGSGGMRNRILAYAAHHICKLNGIELVITPTSPSLIDKNQVNDLINSLQSHGKFDVVFIDTFARSISGGDENSGETVGAALANCKRIHTVTGALVALVHHTGKDISKGARGWSGLKAAADCEIEMSNDEGVRSMRISKQKDEDDGVEWGVNLIKIPIGEDEDGEIISSCVVEYTSNIVRKIKPKARGENERAVLKAFDELGGVQASTEDIINKALTFIPRDPAKRDQRRAYVRRAITSLGSDGVFEVTEDMVKKPI